MSKELLLSIIEDLDIHSDIHIILDTLNKPKIHFKINEYEFSITIDDGVLWCTSPRRWCNNLVADLDLSNPESDPISWLGKFIENRKHIAQKITL